MQQRRETLTKALQEKSAKDFQLFNVQCLSLGEKVYCLRSCGDSRTRVYKLVDGNRAVAVGGSFECGISRAAHVSGDYLLLLARYPRNDDPVHLVLLYQFERESLQMTAFSLKTALPGWGGNFLSESSEGQLQFGFLSASNKFAGGFLLRPPSSSTAPNSSPQLGRSRRERWRAFPCKAPVGCEGRSRLRAEKRQDCLS